MPVSQRLFLIGPLAFLALGAGICAVSFVLLPWHAALVSCGLGVAMLAIAIVDAKHFIIPDILSLPAIPAGILIASLNGAGASTADDVLHYTGAAVLGFALLYTLRWGYRKARGFEGLGLGDVKLAAAAGAWTGFAGLSLVLIAACALAFAYLLARMATTGRSAQREDAMPFGMCLAPPIWGTWLYQTATLYHPV